MQVILSIASGASSGRSVSVKTGQVIKVGRSGGVDLMIADDDQLADVHFSLTCDSRNCYLRVADGASAAEVNDQVVMTSVLRDGDRVSAGSTVFQVKFGDAAEVPAEPVPDPPVVAETPATVAAPVPPPSTPQSPPPPNDAGWRDAGAEECRRELSLDGAPAALVREGETGRQLLSALIENDHHAEAIRVLAYLLPKRRAVEWAVACIADVASGATAAGGSGEQAALDAAREWAADPGEEKRRAAHAAAEAAEFQGAGCWAALGAFWSGGSISDVGQAEVPPVDNLTAQAVSAALTMAAVTEPSEAANRYKKFLELGQQPAG